MGVIMACTLSLVFPFLVRCADEACGSCENVVLWRGHFNATGAEKSVNLSINGGQGSGSAAPFDADGLPAFEAFAASVWLNDVFLKTSYGKSVHSLLMSIMAANSLCSSTNNMNIIEETDDKFIFPDGALKLGDNAITIVQVLSFLLVADARLIESCRTTWA